MEEFTKDDIKFTAQVNKNHPIWELMDKKKQDTTAVLPVTSPNPLYYPPGLAFKKGKCPHGIRFYSPEDNCDWCTVERLKEEERVKNTQTSRKLHSTQSESQHYPQIYTFMDNS